MKRRAKVDPFALVLDHVRDAAGDFALRLARYGRIVTSSAPRGAVWRLDVVPCGHTLERSRRPGSEWRLRIVVCEHCEAAGRSAKD